MRETAPGPRDARRTRRGGSAMTPAILLATLALAGCAARRVPGPDVGPRPLLQALDRPVPVAVALDGTASGDVPWLGLRGTADAALRLAADGAGRLEIRTPFGSAAFVAVATAEGLTAVDAGSGVVAWEEDPQAVLRERSGGWLDLAGVASLFSGRIPEPLRPDPAALPPAAPGGKGGAARYSWTAPGGAAVELEVAPGSGLPGRLRVEGVGVTWSGWVSREGCLLPTAIGLDLGERWGRLEVRAPSPSCPPSAPPAWFEVHPPDTLRRIPLSEWLP